MVDALKGFSRANSSTTHTNLGANEASGDFKSRIPPKDSGKAPASSRPKFDRHSDLLPQPDREAIAKEHAGGQVENYKKVIKDLNDRRNISVEDAIGQHFGNFSPAELKSLSAAIQKWRNEADPGVSGASPEFNSKYITWKSLEAKLDSKIKQMNEHSVMFAKFCSLSPSQFEIAVTRLIAEKNKNGVVAPEVWNRIVEATHFQGRAGMANNPVAGVMSNANPMAGFNPSLAAFSMTPNSMATGPLGMLAGIATGFAGNGLTNRL